MFLKEGKWWWGGIDECKEGIRRRGGTEVRSGLTFAERDGEPWWGSTNKCGEGMRTGRRKKKKK